jgi:ABC-type polysaccharide/polyol phosphate export permease
MVLPAMRNKVLLVGYLLLFFSVVGSYESYRDNTYLVALAAAVILISGLGFWIASIRPKPEK